MDSVRKAIIYTIRSTDVADPQAVQKARETIYVLKRSLHHYETFKKSLLIVDDLD